MSNTWALIESEEMAIEDELEDEDGETEAETENGERSWNTPRLTVGVVLTAIFLLVWMLFGVVVLL